MKDNTRNNIGLELLVQQYKKKFEIEENLNYYEHKDFAQAKRKYIKYELHGSYDTWADQSG